MLLPYTDQLNCGRQEILKRLKHFSSQFVLAGGTAIMLQIGHRLSYDFDCFTEKNLPKTLLVKVRRIIGRAIKIKLQTEEMITVKTAGDIEISFVWHPYKPLRKPVETDYISLFHLDDLVTNKALTIGRRGAWRDYVDLFFFLKWKLYDLEKIIKMSQKRFAGEFNDKLFLQQIVYFDDLKIIPTVFLKESYTPSEIKAFLERQVERYVKKIIA